MLLRYILKKVPFYPLLFKVYFEKGPFYPVLLKPFPREGSSWRSFPPWASPCHYYGGNAPPPTRGSSLAPMFTIVTVVISDGKQVLNSKKGAFTNDVTSLRSYAIRGRAVGVLKKRRKSCFRNII